MPLDGGQGTAWRVGAAVLKPADAGPAALEWLAGLLTSLDGRSDFRVAPPLRAGTGELTVAGWTAWRYEAGRHEPARWADIIRAGRSFHAAVREVGRPAFLDGRRDRWAVADRVAWGELPSDDVSDIRHLAELLRACRPLAASSQLIHGDLTGNVLFAPWAPPLIIDVSPYWRPVGAAEAVVIADALVFEGADETVLEVVRDQPDFAQYLVRALLFRMVTDQLARRGRAADPAAADLYAAPARLALRLARG